MAREVKIPFRDEFARLMEDGQKVKTTRNEKYGDVADYFWWHGFRYELKAVEKMRLEDVALYYFDEEGCQSPDDFVAVWQKIHPEAGWTPDKEVFVHTFKKMEVTQDGSKTVGTDVAETDREAKKLLRDIRGKTPRCDVCDNELRADISVQEGRCRKCRDLHLVPGMKA